MNRRPLHHRQSGVGLDPDRQITCRVQTLANRHGKFDAHAAVRADAVRARLRHGGGNHFGCRAHHGPVLVLAGVKRKRCDHRQPRSFRRDHSQPRLVRIAHGLDQQRIRAGSGKRLRLRGKCRSQLFSTHFTGEQHLARRPDGCKNQRPRARSLLRNRHSGAIDRVKIGRGARVHGDSIGAETVGQNHLAPRLHIRARHGLHLLGMRQVPCVGDNSGGQSTCL